VTPAGADGPGTGREVLIRPAQPDDVATIYGFIRELAEYERAPDAVTGTPEMLHDALFGPTPSAEALLAVEVPAGGGSGGTAGAAPAGGRPAAEGGAVEGEALGFALFHGTFSTWECRPGIWLEDLFVPERLRRGGVGGRLLAALAEIAVSRGCARLEWTALDWNTPARTFYAGLGAELMDEWTTHRLSGDALTALAARA
jgi:GNAT superfamily N-acetyltransferase